MAKPRATAMDKRAGRRLKRRRKTVGISLFALAAVMGVSMQQIRKYEEGENRIPALRLYLAAKALDKPMEWFFDDANQ